jgi:hypothetical protein
MTHLIYSRPRAAYWGPNERGYTTNILLAGVYSAEQAADIEARYRDDGEQAVTLEQELAELRLYGTAGTVLEAMEQAKAVAKDGTAVLKEAGK